jgi:putative restriction endonuclease
LTIVYASTTRTWFDALAHLRPERVAFWQPTPARPSRIELGELWYFKELGSPQILGFGEYVGWERSTVASLFGKYGLATGYATGAELLAAFRAFNPDFELNTEIGNVILENFTPLDPPVALSSVGLDDLSVRFAYIDDDDPIARYVGGLRQGAPATSFELRDPEAAKRIASKRKVRVGQNTFRRLLLQTYGKVCAFTGPQLEETLQAAHIQPYVDAESNHVRNGLLLRADMHVLFDLGLLTLGPDLRIQVSSKLKGRDNTVESLHGTKAILATVEPSPAAIDFHRQEVFIK